MPSTPPELREDEIRGLGERGYFTREGVMRADCIRAGELASAMDEDDELRAAGVGKLSKKRHQDDIRGDRITWLDRSSAEGPLVDLLDVYEWLMDELNQNALLGLRRYELQLAFYEAPNRGYARHVDAFRGPQSRRVTAICYLNEDWKASDGGALRLFLGEDETVDILPEAGRMVVFLSNQLEHQVLPTDRDRSALTAWYRGPAVI